MTVWNPDAALLQPAGDLTAGRAMEVYETLPFFMRGTSTTPFLFTPAAGFNCPGGATTYLPNVLPADQLQQWTPYIRLKKTGVAGGNIVGTFTYQCSAEGDWTKPYTLMDGALPVPVAISMTLTALAGGVTWTLVRLPPIQGCDGFVRILVSNPGATPADDLTVWAGAIWRP